MDSLSPFWRVAGIKGLTVGGLEPCIYPDLMEGDIPKNEGIELWLERWLGLPLYNIVVAYTHRLSGNLSLLGIELQMPSSMMASLDITLIESGIVTNISMSVRTRRQSSLTEAEAAECGRILAVISVMLCAPKPAKGFGLAANARRPDIQLFNDFRRLTPGVQKALNASFDDAGNDFGDLRPRLGVLSISSSPTDRDKDALSEILDNMCKGW